MRVVQPGSFEKDVKKPKKRGKDLDKLKVIVDLLVARTTAGITFRPEERGGSGQRSNFSRQTVGKKQMNRYQRTRWRRWAPTDGTQENRLHIP